MADEEKMKERDENVFGQGVENRQKQTEKKQPSGSLWTCFICVLLRPQTGPGVLRGLTTTI